GAIAGVHRPLHGRAAPLRQRAHAGSVVTELPPPCRNSAPMAEPRPRAGRTRALGNAEGIRPLRGTRVAAGRAVAVSVTPGQRPTGTARDSFRNIEPAAVHTPGPVPASGGKHHFQHILHAGHAPVATMRAWAPSPTCCRPPRRSGQAE